MKNRHKLFFINQISYTRYLNTTLLFTILVMFIITQLYYIYLKLKVILETLTNS